MDTVTQVENLDEAVCISHSATIIGKDESNNSSSNVEKLVEQFYSWYGNRSERRKILTSNLLNSAQKNLILCRILLVHSRWINILKEKHTF